MFLTEFYQMTHLPNVLYLISTERCPHVACNGTETGLAFNNRLEVLPLALECKEPQICLVSSVCYVL